MGWLTDWNYRKSHIINSAVEAGMNYKVGIKVYFGSGTDGTETVNGLTFGKVYLGGKGRSDFGDVRFTDNDGTTLLKCWLVERVYDDFAIFWVKVTDDLSSNQTIYIYYGKSDATTTSNDAETFDQTGEVGADFDDGETTGLTINLAGDAVSEVITPDLFFSKFQANGLWQKDMNNPIIAYRAGKWDAWSVRELSFVIDEDGYPVKVGGQYIAFYSGKSSSGGYWSIGITKSTYGVTWGDRRDTPVITVGGAGSWKEHGVMAGQVIKRTSDGRYEMLLNGADVSDVLSIGYHYSDDEGESWVDGGQKLTREQFQFSDETNPSTIGVITAIKRSDGTYFMVFEALHQDGGNHWAIFAATATSMSGTWTPFNDGYPILTKTGAGWESVGVANPKIIELDTNEFIIAYNGVTNDLKWRIGFAYSSDLTSWTRGTNNPIIEPEVSGWDSQFTECSAMIKERLRYYLKFYFQGFLAQRAQIGLAVNFQTRYLHLKSTQASDGWIIGKDLDGITKFLAEWVTECATQDGSIAGSTTEGLVDSATIPVPMSNVAFNPLLRFVVFHYSNTDAQGHKFLIRYTNVAGGSLYWTGSEWGSITFFGGKGKYIVRIWDDGINYKCDIINVKTGQSILPSVASIAKASVKAFANGRVFVWSEPFDTHYYLGIHFENLFIRKYTDPEPAHSTWGSEESWLRGSSSIVSIMEALEML